MRSFFATWAGVLFFLETGLRLREVSEPEPEDEEEMERERDPEPEEEEEEEPV